MKANRANTRLLAQRSEQTIEGARLQGAPLVVRNCRSVTAARQKDRAVLHPNSRRLRTPICA